MTDGELHKLLDAAKLLLRGEHWAVIDDLLEHYADAAWRMDVDLLMGWAMMTLPVKSKLKWRARFIAECTKFHSHKPNSWKGLK